MRTILKLIVGAIMLANIATAYAMPVAPLQKATKNYTKLAQRQTRCTTDCWPNGTHCVTNCQ